MSNYRAIAILPAALLFAFVVASPQQSSPLVLVVENAVRYEFVFQKVMVKAYLHVARQELKVRRIPGMRFHLVGDSRAACRGQKGRALVKALAGNPPSCVEVEKCELVHAWLPDGHPAFYVPVMVRVLADCNSARLTPGQFDALSQRVGEMSVNWRYDEMGIP